MAILTHTVSAQQLSSEETDNPLSARVLLSAINKTTLSSQIAGRITGISVKAGDHFKTQQTLIAIDCEVQKAQRDKALAEVTTARAKLKVQRQLEKLNSGSTLNITLAQASVKQAIADLAIINISIKMCNIKAPFTGQVIEREVQPYEYVSIGQPILEIIDNRHLEIKLIVPSNWLAWLKPGQKFTVQLDDNKKSYPASITRIGARIDSASQSLNVTGIIDQKAPELIAGMSGTAQFILNNNHD
ncbi:MAG: efflux RND transporter periplasmic adaptor subunit [Gammaproteobacteria bacterium]|nr:efflux RND transporter periplasmic adaptor subunit [Gammaproteobacteria bacterium]